MLAAGHERSTEAYLIGTNRKDATVRTIQQLSYLNPQERKHWRRIKPVLQEQTTRELWHSELEDFRRQKLEQNGFPYWPRTLNAKLTPSDYGPLQLGSRRGRWPEYHKHCTYGACHWTCNLWLYVGTKAFPEHQWRIMTSGKHSTVWNGRSLLFDPTFQALGIPPGECWELAALQKDSAELVIGRLYLHEGIDEGPSRDSYGTSVRMLEHQIEETPDLAPYLFADAAHISRVG